MPNGFRAPSEAEPAGCLGRARGPERRPADNATPSGINGLLE